MKCRLLRDETTLPCEEFPGEWRCRACGATGLSGAKVTRCAECKSPVGQRSGRVPAGTILENPHVASLVRQGIAVPADDECVKAAGNMTPAEMQTAQHSQERLRQGIHPDDFEAFDAGIMAGYNPDGTFKPGPNYADHVVENNRKHGPIIIEDE